MTIRSVFVITTTLLLSACSLTKAPEVEPLQAMEQAYLNKDNLSNDDFIKQLYHSRTWQSAHQQNYDPIALSHASETPVNNAQVKVIGTSSEDAISSLAAKLWLIDQAEHTIDLTYYIFKYDLVGQSILGALCNAVQRGVDVRIMVDSLGSIHPTHDPIRALETCSEDAGYLKDIQGNITPYKARVQFVIINAISSPISWSNRRSHDKLIIKDGNFVGKDITITGGRNISLNYYGIDKEGNADPNTFLDLEVALSSKDRKNNSEQQASIGEISSMYYSLLFLHKGNRRILPINNMYYDDVLPEEEIDDYVWYRREAQKSLTKAMAVPAINHAYHNMSSYFNTDVKSAKVRLAHQLENFTSTNVVENAEKTKAQNANSIEGILKAVMEVAQENIDPNTQETLRIVSPYIFSPQYQNNNGDVIYDGAKALHAFLAKFPNINIEIITNSILTSDNYFTQSVIDMDTAPRLLLPDNLRSTWVDSMEDSELNSSFVNSKQWLNAVNNPRIKIYQTGLADSRILGGDTEYGKLHAKFFFSNDFGFVGTSNFDYRSRLYNNEMGYYFLDEGISQELLKSYDGLKAISLRWGSPKWLAMRKDVFEKDTVKTSTSKSQRGRFKIMKNSGLIWLF